MAVMASSGPGMMLSTCSEYSFARLAMVWRPSAIIPAKGPMPTAITKTMAITRASTERKALRMVRVML